MWYDTNTIYPANLKNLHEDIKIINAHLNAQDQKLEFLKFIIETLIEQSSDQRVKDLSKVNMTHDVSIDRIKAATGLSETSINGYIGRLTHLQTSIGKPIEQVMQDPIPAMRWMIRNIYRPGKAAEKPLPKVSPATMVTYASSVLKLFDLHPEFKRKHTLEYNQWQHFARIYRKKYMEQCEENKLTERESDNTVDFQTLTKKQKEMGKDPRLNTDMNFNLHHLLFSLFLMIKPKRADLGDVYVSRDGLIPESYIKKNFIHLKSGDAVSVLYMKKYKNSNKRGLIKEELDEEMALIIKRSLVAFPRDHLFVHTRGKDKSTTRHPYDKNDSYGKFVRRAFETHFGKTQGVTLWRRVYVTECVDFNTKTYKELKDDAHKSGQSVATQLLVYKFCKP
jgi:hypothetical protein